MLKTLPGSILEPDSDASLADDDLSKVASWAEGTLWEDALKRKRDRLGWALYAAGVGGLGSVIALAVAGPQTWLLIPILLTAVLTLLLVRSAETVRPSARVKSISKVYWAGISLPLGGKAVLYDLSGGVPEETIALRTLNHPDRLHELASGLKELSGDLRVFEGPDEKYSLDSQLLFGIDGNIGECLSSIRQVLADSTEQRLSVSAVGRSDPLLGVLERLDGAMEDTDIGPVISADWASPLSAVNTRIEGVYSLAKSGEQYDIDDVLAELESLLGSMTDRLTEAHASSIGLLYDIYTSATHTATWPAHTAYCPHCNSIDDEEGPRALVRSTALSLELSPDPYPLRCSVCNTSVPEDKSILVTRFKDEVFDPLFDQVYMSLREEILRIERDIENQLVQLEKEQGVAVQRARSDVEKERRKRLGSLREFRSRAAALEAQVTSIAGVLAKYERLHKERKLEFVAESQKIRNDVAERVNRLEKRYLEEFQVMLANADEAAYSAAQIRRAEEERRHREQLDALQDIRVESEMQTQVMLMSPKERDAIRHKGPLDNINPCKQLRIKSARRKARLSRENLT